MVLPFWRQTELMLCPHCGEMSHHDLRMSNSAELSADPERARDYVWAAMLICRGCACTSIWHCLWNATTEEWERMLFLPRSPSAPRDIPAPA
jgi:hypothetical protein